MGPSRHDYLLALGKQCVNEKGAHTSYQLFAKDEQISQTQSCTLVPTSFPVR